MLNKYVHPGGPMSIDVSRPGSRGWATENFDREVNKEPDLPPYPQLVRDLRLCKTLRLFVPLRCRDYGAVSQVHTTRKNAKEL